MLPSPAVLVVASQNNMRRGHSHHHTTVHAVHGGCVLVALLPGAGPGQFRQQQGHAHTAAQRMQRMQGRCCRLAVCVCVCAHWPLPSGPLPPTTSGRTLSCCVSSCAWGVTPKPRVGRGHARLCVCTLLQRDHRPLPLCILDPPPRSCFPCSGLHSRGNIFILEGALPHALTQGPTHTQA